ncbi:MAG: peptidyl-prolyl cis-trans isomerase [Planctomycetes bacterium]|nr:peptidyl-prolyl cis-trans isomerase [Planctomycetota bacterium]
MTCVVPPGSSCSPYGALVLCASLLAGGSCFAAQDTKPAEPPTTKPAQTKPDDDTAPLVYVLMKTSLGEIVLELNREKAPISVKNFLSYTDKEFYDGTIFHRVMSTFMIQGGGFTEDMQKKPTDPPIKNEWKNGLKNVRGSVAMARLNRQPDSATGQFFINVKDNPNLDRPNDGAGYAVFGKVVAGMDVVEAIKSVAVTTGPLNPRKRTYPVEPIVIESVSRLSADEAKERIDAEKKSADSGGSS